MANCIEDVKSAFGLLSRLPFPATTTHRAAAVWAWPIVGLVLGALTAAIGWFGLWLGIGASVVAVLMLIGGALATGALHEDGLADCADGFFGGWTAERRLEIMKDSHIGSYGTLALILVILAKWQALSQLIILGGWGAMIAAAVLSRAPMAVVMATLAPARKTGLSHGHGQPPFAAAALACVLAFGLAFLLCPIAPAMALAGGLCAFGLALYAKARIGGQTGDVLGASQQLAELSALIIASALLTP